MSHVHTFLDETAAISRLVDTAAIENMAESLATLKGRLFIVGLGGSAANASHAVNDFRKLCGIEAYAPSDNVSELTARANDDGWAHIYSDWLRGSRACSEDALLVLSVGGGIGAVSVPLVNAVALAKIMGMDIYGIVGRDGGYTALVGNHVIIIPTVAPERVTPHVEAWQSVILHCLVSHPLLQKEKTKW